MRLDHFLALATGVMSGDDTYYGYNRPRRKRGRPALTPKQVKARQKAKRSKTARKKQRR